MSDFQERKISSEVIFKGKVLDLRRDVVELPNRKKATREWINHPGAVVIIPILPSNKIGLIRQYRYAPKNEFIELPAGKLDENEDPMLCAKRELEEEIGYKPNKLTYLTKIFPAIGFANEVMFVFLAEELEKTQSRLDEDEFIELLPTSVENAVSMVWEGKITTVKTIIGILWFDKIRKN